MIGKSLVKRVLQFRKTNLWIAPVLGAIIAILVAAGSLYMDSRIDWGEPPLPFFRGEPDTARTALSVIASSVTTLLALIFTVIVVAIQLASSQYSPRTLSSLLQDRPSHFTIGVFVGTFTYTLVILLALRKTQIEDGTISGISISLAFLFAIISLGTFAVYSNHIIQAVRITSLINRVGTQVRQAVNDIYKKPFKSESKLEHPKAEPDQIIFSSQPGALIEIDNEKIFDLAQKENCAIYFLPQTGSFLPEGYPIAKVYGSKNFDLGEHIVLSGTRTLQNNIMYGLRQLSDMAVRANSTGINDPATAVQVLDQIHDILRRLVVKDMRPLVMKDKDNNIRLYAPMPSWDDVLRVGLDEVQYYGATSLQVVRRMRTILFDLLTIAPQERKGSLKKQLKLLDKTITENFSNNHYKELARSPDIKGTGF
ncbi:DUF2254 domain-containing protein [Cytophagaceae bacterium ABcell3]|nr:DUF2254 domain-containing protein [Cytophagaceae bacterium ABcell3]